ncbi:MAG: DUF2029 domain-containing protein [Rhodospirillales bacterium]|nr:DUF2029 domain-containing protein [Rhodospirillales bacterium]MDE2575887.1 DUF2029 domain-containing protein [Rhodospirillales bacterium]
MRRLPPPWELAATGAAMLVLEGIGLALQSPGEHHAAFAAVLLAQGALYAVAVRGVWAQPRASLGLVLAIACLLRAGPLLAPPHWSNDINRYVWDGRVQAAGFNPYCCLPDDARLAALRDSTIYPGINRATTAPTIYPPIAQMGFRLAQALGDSVGAMKAVMLGFEIIGVLALLRLLRRAGRPPAQIILYAWLPLPVWEIAGSGHVDALAVGFVALTLLAAAGGRRIATGILLGCATLTKFFPLVLAPALWRRGDRRMPTAFAVTLLLAYLPFISAGAGVLGFLPGYTTDEHLAAGRGFWPVDLLHRGLGLAVTPGLYVAFCGVVMAGLAIGALLRGDREAAMLRWSARLGLATMVLFTPHYDWYFVWLVPLLLLGWERPYWPGLWLALTGPLLYADPFAQGVPLWVGGILYGGFILLSLGDVIARRRTPAALHAA